METLIIDRQKWLRGTSHSALLLDGTKTMCCLGFYSKHCGLKDEDILEVGAVHRLRNVEIPEKMKWLVDNDSASEIAYALMMANDSMRLKDEDREKIIFDYFAEKGVKVEFIN